MRARAVAVRGRGVPGGFDASRGVAAPESRLQLVRDPLRIALVVLTILNISRVHQHYPILASLRPVLVLVIACIGYAALNPAYLTQADVFRRWPIRLVVLLGVMACTSAAFGISLGGSASFILDSYVKTLAYAFLLALSIRHVRDLFTLVWAYVISCGILAFFSIFVFGISKTGTTYVTRLNNLYTYDSNDLGVVLMVGLPLTLLLLSLHKGAKRWLLVLILIGISATMARSGSRGGFLGFVAVGVAALLLANGVPASKRAGILVVAVLTLAYAAPPGYWKQMGTILRPTQDYNYFDPEGRKAVMERGIGYMLRYPVFGVGIANFNRAECTISPKAASARLNGPLRCTAPHNSYLQAGAELGIPGLIIWISLAIGSIIGPLRLRRRLPRSWLRGTEAERFVYGATTFFSLAMIGFAITSFFVSFAWMDTLYFMAALLTGLYLVVQQQLQLSKSPAGPQFDASPNGGLVAGWRVRRSAHRSEVRRALLSG